MVMDQNSREKDAAPRTIPLGQTKPSTAESREIGGPKGPEPIRYGDWEYNGRCTDF